MKSIAPQIHARILVSKYLWKGTNMNPDFKNKKTALFVDLISIFHNVNTVFPRQKLDYKAYLDRLKSECEIYRAVAYGAYIGNEATKFINALKYNGYEVKYIPATTFSGKPVIKYTDRSMDIALDIIRMIDRIDVVIIGSCNLNLKPLYIFLKEKGIKVVIFACNISTELKNAVDEWWEIDEELLEVKNEVEIDIEDDPNPNT
jgi:uncharacterized LabA/DUF88 family protein